MSGHRTLLLPGASRGIAPATGQRFHRAGRDVVTAALLGVDRESAHYLDSKGVRVNAILPGVIATPMRSPGTKTIVAMPIPMHRRGEPANVAEVSSFLCSEKASCVDGAEIHLAGGQHV